MYVQEDDGWGGRKRKLAQYNPYDLEESDDEEYEAYLKFRLFI